MRNNARVARSKHVHCSRHDSMAQSSADVTTMRKVNEYFFRTGFLFPIPFAPQRRLFGEGSGGICYSNIIFHGTYNIRPNRRANIVYLRSAARYGKQFAYANNLFSMRPPLCQEHTNHVQMVVYFLPACVGSVQQQQ